jgi:hypothetical protein
MAARRERVQDDLPACHPRAIRAGLGRFLAVSPDHSHHADLRQPVYGSPTARTVRMGSR